MEGYVYGSKACDDNGERTIKDPWKVAGWILEVPDNKRNRLPSTITEQCTQPRYNEGSNFLPR